MEGHTQQHVEQHEERITPEQIVGGYIRHGIKPAMNIAYADENSLYITTDEPCGCAIGVEYANRYGIETLKEKHAEDRGNEFIYLALREVFGEAYVEKFTLEFDNAMVSRNPSPVSEDREDYDRRSQGGQDGYEVGLAVKSHFGLCR